MGTEYASRGYACTLWPRCKGSFLEVNWEIPPKKWRSEWDTLRKNCPNNQRIDMNQETFGQDYFKKYSFVEYTPEKSAEKYKSYLQTKQHRLGQEIENLESLWKHLHVDDIQAENEIVLREDWFSEDERLMQYKMVETCKSYLERKRTLHAKLGTFLEIGMTDARLERELKALTQPAARRLGEISSPTETWPLLALLIPILLLGLVLYRRISAPRRDARKHYNAMRRKLSPEWTHPVDKFVRMS